jgi:hypothetical protein
MKLYTEAHFKSPEGRPQVGAIVPDSLSGSDNAYGIMSEIVKQRWVSQYPGQEIGTLLVFACHEGDPDPSLNLSVEEKNQYFPPTPQTSVRILGTH